MKKLKKHVLPLFLMVLMAAGLSTNAFAAETNEMHVQVGENQISFSDAGPVIKGGRIFVPDGTVFEALGAQYSYNSEAKTATAVRGKTTVQFTLGKKNMVITESGNTKTIETDASPFTQNGHFMIPVRYEAQAFSCNVGFDYDSNTVLILDADSILGNTSFTIMDKYLDHFNKLQKSPLMFSGSFNLSLKITSDGFTIPIVSKGTVSGICNSNALNMNMTVNTDLQDLMSTLSKLGQLDDNSKDQLNMLQNINVKYIMNLAENKMYIQSPLLSKMMNIQENAWISLNLNDFTGSYGLQDPLACLDCDQTNMRAVLKGIFNSIPLTNSYDITNASEMLNLFKSIYGDDAFVKSGNTYTSEYTFAKENVSFTYKVVLLLKGDDLSGFNISMNMKDNAGSNMNMTYSMDEHNKLDLTMNLSDPDTFEAAFQMVMRYSTTYETPKNAPDDGSIIVTFGK